MRLIIMGPPGAGKGTQAAKIVDEFNIVHISTGDIFRQNIKDETELGQQVKDILDKGQLVPDDITIQMVKNRLEEEDVKKGFLLDGFPRSLPQAKALDEILEEQGIKLDRVLNIDVDPEILVDRISGRRVCSCGASFHIEANPPKKEGICDECGGELIQRADDNEETVKDRINVYETQTAPLIDYYEKQDLVFTVDGSQGIDEISKTLIDELK